jgi:Ternary complex associated domain 9
MATSTCRTFSWTSGTIYVIDFSETRPRNIVSDFARLEPILKFEMVPIENATDLWQMLQFEQGLLSSNALDDLPPMTYPGTSAAVDKAFAVITLLRRLADTATIFETDTVPYWPGTSRVDPAGGPLPTGKPLAEAVRRAECGLVVRGDREGRARLETRLWARGAFPRCRLLFRRRDLEPNVRELLGLGGEDLVQP